MKVLRAGLCVVVAFAVLSHGAVEPWSESILQISAALFFLWWGVLTIRSGRLDLRLTPLLLPVLGLVVWAMGQWVFGLSMYP